LKWHSGISLVVPSTKIWEIINQPKLRAYENEVARQVKESESKNGPIETSTVVKEESRSGKTADLRFQPITRRNSTNAPTKATQRKKRAS
jgi:hypothetical protein